MDNIPHESILRYHPKDDSAHSTAVMVEGTLLEVKREGQTVRNRYPSVDVWLLSFPGASWADVVVSHPSDARPSDARPEPELESEDKTVGDEKEQKPKPKKTEKAKTPEKPKLQLIPMSRQIYAVTWTHHLHQMMKEANPALLKREDVIQAFNGLVNVLLEHQMHVYTITPILSNRYDENTVLPDMTKPNKELCVICHVEMNSVRRDQATGRMVIHRRYYRPCVPAPSKEELLISNHILNAYLPLLELIRDDILPHMERMRAETKKKQIDREIQRKIERMERLQEKFDQELDRRKRLLGAFIQNHEEDMREFRNSIARLVSSKSE